MYRDPSKRYANAQDFCDALIKWRDGDEKKREALQIIQTANDKLKKLGTDTEITGLHRQGATMLQRLPKNVAEEKKYSAWKLLDESKAIGDEVEMVKLSHVQSLTTAIARAPGLDDGHMALAQFFRNELIELEKGNDPIAVNRCKESLQRHTQALSNRHPHKAELFQFLRGDGEIDVTIEPVKAEIEMETYHERLHPDFTQHLGRKQQLKINGYGVLSVYLSCKSAESVYFPVMIDRLRWTCVYRVRWITYH